MSNPDQMLLELDELLPEKKENSFPKVAKRKAKDPEPVSIEVPPAEISVVEVIAEVIEAPEPVLSVQTRAEMEAGRKVLQNYR